MKKLLGSACLLLGLLMIGTSAYAQCHMNKDPGAPISVRPDGRFQFRVIQGHGTQPIGTPNGLLSIKCGPAGSPILWHTDKVKDGGTFQPKIDAILDNINATSRILISDIMIYTDDGPPKHYMSLDFGRPGNNIIKDQQNIVSFLGPGTYRIAFFGGASIIGGRNTTTDISLSDTRPIFTVVNGTVPRITFAIEYAMDPDLPDPEYCHVRYDFNVAPQGKINLGVMSKGDLDNQKEKVTDVRLITKRYMSGDGCYKEKNPTVRLTATTNLPRGSAHEAKMANGTSVFIYNVITQHNIVREWPLDGMSTQAVGNFNVNNENETLMRFIWKKTAGATVKTGSAEGTIYIKAEMQ